MAFTTNTLALPILNTSATFIATNPILKYGQLAQETDTNRSKSGDGVSTYTQLSYGEFAYEIVEATGTDTYVGTFGSPFFLAYFPMQRIRVRFLNANTGPATINLQNLGAKSIKKNVSAALASGDILAGGIYDLTYDGTNFQINGIGSGGGGASPLTTKGDIYTYSTVNARLPVGSDGQVLQALSSDTTGLAWSTATYPVTATTVGAYLRSDGTNWITSTLILPNAVTAGSVIFATATNTYGQDNANFFYDDTNNCLILGATTRVSQELLSIQSAANISLIQLTKNSSAGNAAIALYRFENNLGTVADFGMIGNGYTASGAFTPNYGYFYCNGGGINFINDNAGDISFYTGGFAAGNKRIFINNLGATTISVSTTSPLIYGVATSGGVLTIQSTSHATKGNIYFGSSTGLNYDETNKTLGIGVAPSGSSIIIAARRDQNGSTYTQVKNSTAGAGAYTFVEALSDSVTLRLFASSSATTAYGGFTASMGSIYCSHDLALICDASGKNIIFMNGGSPPTERGRITSAGILKIAGTVTRATTEGTNHLDIFDGTAPVGTLANGISLYSTAGELRVMDAAGNATLLSPHEKKTNFWIYDSVDTVTGKHLKIDMERMMKFLNTYFGTNFVHEFKI